MRKQSEKPFFTADRMSSPIPEVIAFGYMSIALGTLTALAARYQWPALISSQLALIAASLLISLAFFGMFALEFHVLRGMHAWNARRSRRPNPHLARYGLQARAVAVREDMASAGQRSLSALERLGWQTVMCQDAASIRITAGRPGPIGKYRPNQLRIELVPAGENETMIRVESGVMNRLFDRGTPGAHAAVEGFLAELEPVIDSRRSTLLRPSGARMLDDHLLLAAEAPQGEAIGTYSIEPTNQQASLYGTPRREEGT